MAKLEHGYEHASLHRYKDEALPDSWFHFVVHSLFLSCFPFVRPKCSSFDSSWVMVWDSQGCRSFLSTSHTASTAGRLLSRTLEQMQAKSYRPLRDSYFFHLLCSAVGLAGAMKLWTGTNIVVKSGINKTLSIITASIRSIVSKQSDVATHPLLQIVCGKETVTSVVYDFGLVSKFVPADHHTLGVKKPWLTACFVQREQKYY